MRLGLLALLLCAACGGGGSSSTPAAQVIPLPEAPSLFVNWENLSVHPLALTPDGSTLIVCNTPDARLEVFDVSGGLPVALGSVPVGLDPVSVRARSDSEAWVVNRISDSVSVVDLPTLRVRATLRTLDEPADVVFAGGKAWVSCQQANAVLAFDPADLAAAPATVPVEAEEPCALAASADGTEVYVAIFQSGNRTTVLGGGIDPNGTLGGGAFPPGAVNDAGGPHGGQNPPPNAGAVFDPPMAPSNPPPPAVSLIVKQDAAGAWRDDTGADWTELVSGAKAARSGRPVGWELLDHDVAVITTATRAVRYVDHCMNICMAIEVRGDTGEVLVAGTDATNEVRFEPKLDGRFVRVELASVGAPGAVIHDLNPHLTYATPTVPQALRNQSLGDPRGIAWDAANARGYVTGMGSNNVVVIDGSYARVATIDVGEGPTGIVLEGGRLFVLNRFEDSVSVVDTATRTETARVPLHDPTSEAVKKGRHYLYATHERSGLGDASCASCHVDARMDRLAWDLGDPAGAMKPFDQECLTDVLKPCEDFHPMKGPMLTQTLQDIVGKEPFHWRGDRKGIEEFNPAFETLLGDDEMLAADDMQEFEDFLATITFPPNPFRNLDNSLPTQLPLPGHFTTGRFGPAGTPLPPGDAVEGLRLYRTANLDGGVPGFQCVSCHTLPVGVGPAVHVSPTGIVPAPPGPMGETHHALVSVDGTTNVSMKVPQLRTLYERVGFELTQPKSLTGFGFLHDGTVDSLARFVSEPVFNVQSDQEVADLVAFLLSFSGSDLPVGSMSTLTELPGPPGRDTPAGVGFQVTLDGTHTDPKLAEMRAIADGGEVELIAKGAGRGWVYEAGRFQSDRNGETATFDEVLALAAPGSEITFTLVPRGTGRRLGIDRDDDRYGDATERDLGTDPADPADHP
jgi:YVTN family beta-propeller protein